MSNSRHAALVEALDELDPYWREAYECNPYAAALDIMSNDELDELGLPTYEDDLLQLADDYEEFLRDEDS